MTSNLGNKRSIFYFDVGGEINTKKCLELAFMREKALNLKKC